MPTVVGVRFKKAGKVFYFSPGKLHLDKDDAVIVETTRGQEFGRVVLGEKEVSDSETNQPLKTVQRKATEADFKRLEENHAHEKEAFAVCQKKIKEHGLPMRLVDVEYSFDVSRIIFFFTAEGRIDFRELVKDLASVFRTRIELRQIGVRDEAKHIGGIGCCGRSLCCATFLGDFVPVSIRMAKGQNMSLNPAKISGVCGRLMCCLKFENDYGCGKEKKQTIEPPIQGSRVISGEGAGKVISLNVQRRLATILLDDGKTVVTAWDDVAPVEDLPADAPSGRVHKSHGEKSGKNYHKPGEEKKRVNRDTKENKQPKEERMQQLGSEHNGKKDAKDKEKKPFPLPRRSRSRGNPFKRSSEDRENQ